MTKFEKGVNYFLIGSLGYFIGRICEAIAVGNIKLW